MTVARYGMCGLTARHGMETEWEGHGRDMGTACYVWIGLNDDRSQKTHIQKITDFNLKILVITPTVGHRLLISELWLQTRRTSYSIRWTEYCRTDSSPLITIHHCSALICHRAISLNRQRTTKPSVLKLGTSLLTRYLAGFLYLMDCLASQQPNS